MMSLYGSDVLIWTFFALAENYGDSGYQRFIEAETGWRRTPANKLFGSK